MKTIVNVLASIETSLVSMTRVSVITRPPWTMLVTRSSVTGTQPQEFRDVGFEFQQLEQGSLFLPEAAPQHKGHYLCQASNGIGPALSKLVKLNVLGNGKCFSAFDENFVGSTEILVDRPKLNNMGCLS